MEKDLVLPDKIVKGYFVKPRPYHAWYYMSHQTPDDIALFTTWDSRDRSSDTASKPFVQYLESSLT